MITSVATSQNWGGKKKKNTVLERSRKVAIISRKNKPNLAMNQI
jgi:hypothetical protein